MEIARRYPEIRMVDRVFQLPLDKLSQHLKADFKKRIEKDEDD